MPIPLVNSFVNNAYSPTRYRSLSFTGKIKLRTIQQWDRLTAKKAEHFISNSETIKQSNARALAVPLDKIQVIYRGRDQSKYAGASQEKLMSLKSELNIRDKRVLLNVSRLLERKGQADLIKAFARLEGVASGQIVLLIAGEGLFVRNWKI